MLLNQQEAFPRPATESVIVTIASVVAQICAFTGVVAGFWHILPIASVGVLVSGTVGAVVHSTGYARLEQNRETPSQEA